MALKKKNGKVEKAVEKAPEKKKSTAAAPATGKSWFQTGDEGLARKRQIDHMNAMRKERGVPRFFLKHKPGSDSETGAKQNEARIVFLDDKGFYLYEHNLKIEGRWGNFYTCVRDVAPCPVCEHTGDKPTYTCYYTVIDTRKWAKKDGTISKARKVLFPAKGTAMELVAEMRADNDGRLRGLVVDVKRLGERDPNCGRDFKVVGRVDPAKKFEAEMITPYDYGKILAPPEGDELEGAGIKVNVPVGSDADVGEEETDENVKDLLGD